MFGDGGVPLPLTFVDNAVDALILAAVVPGIAGEPFNIVDDDVLTQRDYLELLRQCTGGMPHVLRLPLSAYYLLGQLTEWAAALGGKEPETTRHRIRNRLTRVTWDCSKAARMLQWQPRVPLRDGLARTFRTYASRGSSD
jgi:nucleoside-diphosphate-sugar epimerase